MLVKIMGTGGRAYRVFDVLSCSLHERDDADGWWATMERWDGENLCEPVTGWTYLMTEDGATFDRFNPA